MGNIAENRKASFEYYLEDRFEAGIELVGSEVKSVRNQSVSLADSFCRIKNGEAYILNMFISKYDKNSIEKIDERRTRKLLLHRSEINKLERKVKEKGLAIVPIRVYFSGKHVKVEIALGRGKKLYDKKQTIKERDIKRETERERSGK